MFPEVILQISNLDACCLSTGKAVLYFIRLCQQSFMPTVILLQPTEQHQGCGAFVFLGTEQVGAEL